ncbi:hypothetical protein AOLI_G00262230 [Acnodon oligacanthus]
MWRRAEKIRAPLIRRHERERETRLLFNPFAHRGDALSGSAGPCASSPRAGEAGSGAGLAVRAVGGWVALTQHCSLWLEEVAALYAPPCPPQAAQLSHERTDR